jgi:hypothetical protein
MISDPSRSTTGRSAAFYAETYGGPAVQPLTTASKSFFEAPPEGFATVPLLTPRGGLHIANAAVRPAGEDAEPGDRERLRETFGIEADETAFLFAALNPRLKGVETLLKAAARLEAAGESFVVLAAGFDGYRERRRAATRDRRAPAHPRALLHDQRPLPGGGRDRAPDLLRPCEQGGDRVPARRHPGDLHRLQRRERVA